MSNRLKTQSQGFEVYRLKSDAVELCIIPELGAKISSLITARTGRQWMWSATSDYQLHRNQPGDLFSQSTMLGADECIPTITACDWGGLHLPDHGEAWSMPWDVQATLDTVTTTLRLPISPLEIKRTVSLQYNVIRFAYELTNHSAQPFEYIWAFHPLITHMPGDWLDVPCTRVHCDPAFTGQRRAWPYKVHEGEISKSYPEDLTWGSAIIRNDQTGEFLAFTFDMKKIPTVGLLDNRGGWKGYHFFAIEPMTGAPDPLDVAVTQWKQFAVAQPQETKNWHFEITCH